MDVRNDGATFYFWNIIAAEGAPLNEEMLALPEPFFPSLDLELFMEGTRSHEEGEGKKRRGKNFRGLFPSE